MESLGFPFWMLSAFFFALSSVLFALAASASQSQTRRAVSGAIALFMGFMVAFQLCLGIVTAINSLHPTIK